MDHILDWISITYPCPKSVRAFLWGDNIVLHQKWVFDEHDFSSCCFFLWDFNHLPKVDCALTDLWIVCLFMFMLVIFGKFAGFCWIKFKFKFEGMFEIVRSFYLSAYTFYSAYLYMAICLCSSYLGPVWGCFFMGVSF